MSNSQPIEMPQSQVAEISSVDELRSWLASNGIDTSLWGRGSAKTIDSLFAELVSGECQLQEAPALRVVSLVQVLVRRANLVLVETEQELSDRRRRSRNHPLGEKIRAGESCHDTALRGLREELGVEPTQVKILDGALRQYREEGASPSYPGLITRYLIHIVEVEIEGLPDKDFATQEGSRAGGETIKKHHWSWKPFDEDRPSRI